MTRSHSCPKCGGELDYGALLDCVTGQRGWACNECNVAYSALEVSE